MSVRAAALLCWCCLALLAADTAVFAQGCGKVDPRKVDKVPEFIEHRATINALSFEWESPDDLRNDFFYLISCSGCPVGEVNTTGTRYTFTNLKSATEYPVSVRAGLANCAFSDSVSSVGRTILANLQGSIGISEVTQTSFNASWTASVDVGVFYRISCGGIMFKTNNTFYVCSGMSSGTQVTVKVRAEKDGFPEDRQSLFITATVYTNLYAIDLNSVKYSRLQTSITVFWEASKTTNVNYELRCSGPGANVMQPTTATSATCYSLQSGEAYMLTVTVRKSGYDDAVRNLGIQRTRLHPISTISSTVSDTTSITVSWPPSQTSNVHYQLSCSGAAGVKNVSTSSTSATCSQLQSGEAYTLTVTVMKSGGFDDESYKHGSVILTKLYAVLSSTARYTTSETDITVSWSASITSNVYYALTCTGPGGTKFVSTSGTSATCSSLQSGETYTLTVTVRKSGGFDDAVNNLGTQLTKLFAIESSSVKYIRSQTSITVSWNASQTSNVYYVLSCIDASANRVEQGSTGSSATCSSLQSGQAYTVTVTVKKSGYVDAVRNLGTQLTKLYPISAIQSITHYATSITVSWTASQTSNVYYQLSCSCSCPGGVTLQNTTGTSATCSPLQSGESYTVTVTVMKSGGFDDASYDHKSFILTNLSPIEASSTSITRQETAITASWQASKSRGVSYTLLCSSPLGNKIQDTSGTSAACDSLQSGEAYTLTVTVKKSGYDSAPTSLGIQRTKLFAIEPSSVKYDVTQNAITVTWGASKTSGVTYELMCQGAGLTRLQSTSSTAAACYPLQSGEAYTVAVTVRKSGGFDDAVANLVTQLTKLSGVQNNSASFTEGATSVTVSWRASGSVGVTYLLICSILGGSSSTTVPSTGTTATCAHLESGQVYRMTLKVRKAGGFEDATTELGTAMTKLIPIDSSTADYITTETTIYAKWAQPATRGIDFVLICISPSGSSVSVTSQSNSAMCENLHSGEAYVLRVAVRKPGGWQDAVTDLGTQRTRLFPIKSSSATARTSESAITVAWKASETAGVSYVLNCTSSTVGTKSVTTTKLTATCESLESGRRYLLTVKVMKDGGFADSVTELGIQETKEAPSSRVRNLRISDVSTESAVVEFDEPEMKNGVILAYGIQSFESPGAPCTLLLMNMSSESCEISTCLVDQIIANLTRECNLPVTHLQTAESRQMKVKIEHLKEQTNYSVRLTPISQTLMGQSEELSFKTTRSSQVVVIVVSSVVSVLAVGVIVALVVVFVRRANSSNSSSTTSKAEQRPKFENYDNTCKSTDSVSRTTRYESTPAKPSSNGPRTRLPSVGHAGSENPDIDCEIYDDLEMGPVKVAEEQFDQPYDLAS